MLITQCFREHNMEKMHILLFNLSNLSRILDALHQDIHPHSRRVDSSCALSSDLYKHYLIIILFPVEKTEALKA